MFAAYWEEDTWDEAYETEAEAVIHVIRAYSLTEKDTVKVGKITLPEEPQIDGHAIMERLNENLHAQCGAAAELWPGDVLGAKGIEDLGNALTQTLRAFLRANEAWPPDVFVVAEPRDVSVTHEMWIAAFPELADEDEEIVL
jgi:hypothetical protein